jgi:hypothetical protein
MTAATDLKIIKIHIEDIFNAGELSITVHKYKKEKPSVKPCANAIDDEAIKQKYVNPDMNTNNSCLRSFTDNLSNIEKKSGSESQSIKTERKWLLIN